MTRNEINHILKERYAAWHKAYDLGFFDDADCIAIEIDNLETERDNCTD